MSKRAFLILVFITSFCVLYFSFVQRHLYGDGSFYVAQILSKNIFFIPHDQRYFSSIFREILPMVLIWTGVKSPFLISVFYGLNHYLIPIGAIVVSYFLTPGKERFMVSTALATSYLLLFLNTSLNITSETYFAASVFWPTFLLVKYNHSRIAIAISLIVLTFSYEGSFIPLGVIFLLMLKANNRNWLVIGIAVMGMLITLYLTAFPGDPKYVVNREYAGQFIYLLGHGPSIISFIMAILILNSVLRKPVISQKFTTLLFSMLAILLITWTPLFPNSFQPSYQYLGRLLNVLIPSFIAGILLLNDHYNVLQTTTRKGQVLIFIMCFASVVYQLTYTTRWSNYYDLMQKTLAENRGIIPFNQSGLEDNYIFRKFHKRWTTTTFSVLIPVLNGENIETIIKNPEGEIWEPWSPDDRKTWPSFSKYRSNYVLP